MNRVQHRHEFFKIIVPILGCLIVSIYLTERQAQAATIALCPASADFPSNGIIKSYLDSDGSAYVLVAGTGNYARCSTLNTDIVPGKIKWMEVLSQGLANRLLSGLIVQAIEFTDRTEITDISPLVDDAHNVPSPILPLDVNIFASVERVRAYGLEERAEIVVDSGNLRMKCRAGSRPAGAIVELVRSNLPTSMPLRWRAMYRSTQEFLLGFASRIQLERELPFWLKEIGATNVSRVLEVDVPSTVYAQNRHGVFSINCPANAGVIEFDDMRLVSQMEVPRVPPRSIWVWEPRHWITNGHGILSFANRYGAQRVFISVVVDEELGTLHYLSELRSFLALAHANGLDVWVVEGDPYAVLPRERDKFIRRAHVIADFGLGVEKQYRPDGVQYDIEPYLIPGYRLDAKNWLAAYFDTIHALNAALPLPMEVVVPYWWLYVEYEGRSALRKAMEVGDSVNVMLYRTQRDELQRIAQPILDAGVELKKPVSIALEKGPIEIETTQVYVPSQKGVLWMTTIGDKAIILRLSEEISASNGKIFSLRNQRVADADRVTFRATPEKLSKLMPELERVWSLWRSFNGVSIHGID